MIRIRPGIEADLAAALVVWRTANTARRNGFPTPAAHERRVVGYLGKADAFLVVADDEGEVVGMALGMQALDYDGVGPPVAGLCHLAMVFVHPDRWGQGIGSRVLAGVMEQARHEGFDQIQLWTHADNTRAQELYERHGFTRTGRQKDDDLGDLIVHFVCDLGAVRPRP